MVNTSGSSEKSIYKIIVKGYLDTKWSDWFEGMSVNQESNNTILIGEVKDQSALHGILNKIRDLNLFLFLVEKMDFHNNNQY